MTTDPKKVLWANLAHLMRSKWGRENLTRLAKEADIGEATANRLKAGTTSVGLDILQRLARIFRRETWQLLHPQPDAPAFSAPAAKLAALFDALPPDRQEAAFTTVVQVLEFGNTGKLLPAAPPSSDPDHGPGTPPASGPDAPSTTRVPEADQTRRGR